MFGQSTNLLNRKGGEITLNGSTESRDELQALLNKAEALLKARGQFYTDGAKLALTDMMEAAYQALDNGDNVPFRRNREFYTPRTEEAVLFAAKRFTMVPPFDKKGSVYTCYGLGPALDWFKTQDVLHGGKEQLLTKAGLALEKAEQLLSEAEAFAGLPTGCYSPEAVRKLEASAKALKLAASSFDPKTTGEALALAIVDCFNRLRECRHSRVLRTDSDPAASLYLTSRELEQLQQRVAEDPLIKAQYEHIAAISRQYSLEELQSAVCLIAEKDTPYEELNNHFYLWSSTDKIANFRAPDNAATATLSFVLPAEDNEEQGLGHVWIDNLEILSASGASLMIHNSGFDEGRLAPDFWTPEARKGNPVMHWESRYPYCGGGDRKHPREANPSSEVAPRYKAGTAKRSLYICNPGIEDEGAWTYNEQIPVEPAGRYTLTFDAKLDGKLKSGLKAVITFRDEAGQPAGEYAYSFNRKSSVPGGRYQLAMQCDAIQYALTGEINYALKVKNALIYILHDFCQGAEHWMAVNLRPEGSDSYGAVQGGRLLSSAAVSYSMIKQTGVFSSKEKKQFYALVEYLLRYMLDLRDRTEWTDQAAQEGCSNWQTDMCAGTGLMMMVLSDFPNRYTWLYNADTILKAQLQMNVNPDCSWPESIRYHHAALERFAGYAKASCNVTGDNWFKSTPLARMFGYSIQMQTPGYQYFGGRIGTPPFGDHALGGGGEFGSFATYISDVAEVDRELADRMYHSWIAAGKPFKKLWGEGIVLENLLVQGSRYVPESPLELSSTAAYPHAGIYVFRSGYGTPEHSYFAVMSSPEPVAHGHLDQGSFILYKNGVPLVMDPGIEGYFDSSTSWFICSYSHACLQFATAQTEIRTDDTGVINLSAGTFSLERGWADVPRSSRVLDIRLGTETDSITIEIANPEGTGRHIRHITCHKQAQLYIIRDTIEEFEGHVQFNLPVAAQQSTVQGSSVYSQGMYGMDLQTVFLHPLQSVAIEQGRSTAFFGRTESGVTLMDYIRATADAKDGFLTVLYPQESSQTRLKVFKAQDGKYTLLTETHDFTLETVQGQYGVRLETAKQKGAAE